MDNKQEILLGSEKNINSVNVDNYGRVELIRNTSEINEFTVNDVVNSTEVFDAEREQNQVYRIYGRIEWMSLLNGLKEGYSQLKDYFEPTYDTDSKNLIDSFDFYLVAPASGETYGSVSGGIYKRRNFQVLATPNEFEIYNAGYSNNVYGEQVYSFNFNVDFDVREYYDNLGFPLTELFLYPQYKKLSGEEMSRTNFTSTGAKSKVSLTTKDLNIGDIVENHQGDNIQDMIEYSAEEYFQEQVEPQTYFIRTHYYEGFEKWLEWRYNPFIPFRLRYLDGVVSTAKASQIVGNTATLDVYITTSPSNKLNATKSLAQILSTTTSTIRYWDESSPSSAFSWYPNSGEVVFNIPASFSYTINFKTRIYLPNGSDKYIGEIYLEEDTGSSWVEIKDVFGNPITRRKFLTTNSLQSVNIVRTYSYGDRIRVRTRLIPNPDERRMFVIPDYAKLIINDGKYVWRDILPQGYIDPITNLGVDYPFFNNRRYLFDAIVFDVPPNLSTETWDEHEPTQDVFSEIEYYDRATTIDLTPNSGDELDNIGKPCQ